MYDILTYFCRQLTQIFCIDDLAIAVRANPGCCFYGVESNNSSIHEAAVEKSGVYFEEIAVTVAVHGFSRLLIDSMSRSC